MAHTNFFQSFKPGDLNGKMGNAAVVHILTTLRLNSFAYTDLKQFIRKRVLELSPSSAGEITNAIFTRLDLEL